MQIASVIAFILILLLGIAISWYIVHTINADIVHVPLNYNASNIIAL